MLLEVKTCVFKRNFLSNFFHSTEVIVKDKM